MGWGKSTSVARGENGDRKFGWDGTTSLDKEGKDFYRLRESGYKGWIQDGKKTTCPKCHTMSCTAGLTEACN